MVDLNDINKQLANGGGTTVPPPTPAPHTPHEGHIEPDLPRLRTYADDLSVEIKKKGATMATIVGAERERAARELSLKADEEEPAPSRFRNPLMLAVAGVLVVLGIVLIGGAIYFSQTGTVDAPQVQSIVFPNKIVAMQVPLGRSLAELLGTERISAQLALGEVERIDVTLAGATTSAQTILKQLNAPPALIREASAIMLGVHSFDHNQPYIIVTVGQYDRAFGAMLTWEEEMGRSLGAYFRPLNGSVPPTTLFTDKVFLNIDTRLSQTEWPILYAFPRRDVLIITTNQYTLQELVTRLNAQTAVSQ